MASYIFARRAERKPLGRISGMMVTITEKTARALIRRQNESPIDI
jgi:hypothetical protein